MFPSIHHAELISGKSYKHHSDIPSALVLNPEVTSTGSIEASSTSSDPTTVSEGTPCVLGIDEAGRGPVIGPMIYGAFYLPIDLHPTLLTTPPSVFKDSKTLTEPYREQLMQNVCTKGSDLYDHCGWAVKSLSAPSISEGMLRKSGEYNLNTQSHDAIIDLIEEILSRGVNVKELYVDPVGRSDSHQSRLERVFPSLKITVKPKADSLYPVVSAASVVAKVTRDVSCKLLYKEFVSQSQSGDDSSLNETQTDVEPEWSTGYPNPKSQAWLRKEMHPLFGWGNECRFSWATSKDLLETTGKNATGTKVVWPVDGDDESLRVTDFYAFGSNPVAPTANKSSTEEEMLRGWFGSKVGQEAF
ncbi:MAG: hypothetical protein Q9160_005327 [Pyrenula sp. 1 TL-2023]